MRVLFICKANVGRSQMAEALFNKYSKKNKAFSAGTDVGDKEGQTIGQNEKFKFVVDVMKEEEIDVSNNKRRQLTKEMVDDTDKVIIITKKDSLPHYLVDNDKVIFWDIPDAKDTSYEFHIKTREEIKKKVEKLVEELERRQK